MMLSWLNRLVFPCFMASLKPNISLKSFFFFFLGIPSFIPLSEKAFNLVGLRVSNEVVVTRFVARDQ